MRSLAADARQRTGAHAAGPGHPRPRCHRPTLRAQVDRRLQRRSPRPMAPVAPCHRVMVVAGINSSGAAWDRGPTLDLDVDALGYHASRGRGPLLLLRRRRRSVHEGRHAPPDRRLGRAARGAAAPDAAGATRTRGRPRRPFAGRSRGRRVPRRFYRAGDRSFPPLGNVVTLSSPHEGRRSPRWASRCGATRKGKASSTTWKTSSRCHRRTAPRCTTWPRTRR